jgi:meiotically up-regulated gene 157 (Mug157) protein
VKRVFIDASIVDDLMSLHIIGYWQKYEPIFIEMRKLMNTPTVAEYFEYLYGVVHEIWRQQHPGYETVTLSQ